MQIQALKNNNLNQELNGNNSEIIASLNKINLKINQKTILENISCQFFANKITTIIGPNGGGKSSIVKLILQLIKPSSGSIYLKPNLKIGYLPQKINIDRSIPLKAIDFLSLTSNNSVKIIEKNAEIQEIILQMNLKNILAESIHNLSGGQLQKLMLIQTLINQPNFLVLDEPTQYMDIDGIAQFYQIMEQLRNYRKTSILLVSHDLHSVMQKTDEVICINQHVCCVGSPQIVNNHQNYLSLFAKQNIGFYQHNHNHQHF